MQSIPAPLTIGRQRAGEIALSGALTIWNYVDANQALLDDPGVRVVDVSHIDELDSAAALFLSTLSGKGIQLRGLHRDQEPLVRLVDGLRSSHEVELPSAPHGMAWRQWIAQLGQWLYRVAGEACAVINFVGKAAYLVVATLGSFGKAVAAISPQILQSGIRALPIVGLMAVMISVVIGYQSVAQLRPLGSENFAVDLVAVSVLREMGVLITAIMVAGRSGAAFAAEIGVMKMREEIDALEIMGIDAMQTLVTPRLIALVISLPLLAFFADIMGLAGGALISHSLLGVSPLQYLRRVKDAVDGWDLFVGLAKAPVFGFIIGVVGCMRGLTVSGSAESVGEETTRAVVQSIFLVIILDALFSVFFERLGI
jgi:phospholipid/cholesterol/gamma-HCH transport system permease protein